MPTEISKQKSQLTQEITDWIHSEIQNTDNHELINLFNFETMSILDYFHHTDSLRLRAAGYQLLKVFFEHQEFKHHRSFYTNEILKLSKYLNAPFYINMEKIVLFDTDNIVLCKMSGSVENWLNNFPDA